MTKPVRVRRRDDFQRLVDARDRRPRRRSAYDTIVLLEVNFFQAR
jgi:hypothetical protein